MSNTSNISALAESIESGLANEESTGLALRTVQTAMGCSLVKTINETEKGFNKLQSVLDRCLDKMSERIQAELESDTISNGDLFNLVSTIQKNQIAFVELQRKVVQSPNKIFSDELLSPEERKLLQFLKSFKTPQDKQNFLKVVEDSLKPSSSNDFE